ncbi:MAG: Fe-S cluster assembly protein SufD [Candidatus Coatesbacteria bacterium]
MSVAADGSWLEDLRQLAWEWYHDAPEPSRSVHLWRYTDPAIFRIPEQIIDATPRPGLIAPEGPIPTGIEVLDLVEAAMSRPELVRDRLGAAVRPVAGKLEALNFARFQHGLVVHAPAGVVAATPLTLVSKLGGPRFNASRILVIADEDSDLTIVRSYGAGDRKGEIQANGVIEVFAGARAHVRLIVIQDLQPEARLHLAQRTVADRDARVETIVASLGGAVMKADIGTVLAGKGAESESWGVVVGDGAQHFDHHTVHTHTAGHTRSRFNYKTVLKGHARSVYTGSIRIEKDAANCEAYQENRNLMLEETAHADSIPELEILNNEVQCTHGATMGPIEPEYLFYLESRGIPHDDAVRLFVDGFVTPAFNRVPPAVEASLRGHLAGRMERL